MLIMLLQTSSLLWRKQDLCIEIFWEDLSIHLWLISRFNAGRKWRLRQNFNGFFTKYWRTVPTQSWPENTGRVFSYLSFHLFCYRFLRKSLSSTFFVSLFFLSLPFLFFLSFSPCLSLFGLLKFKKVSVKELPEHKLRKQIIQRPHMTKNTDLTKILYESCLTKKQPQPIAAT